MTKKTLFLTLFFLLLQSCMFAQDKAYDKMLNQVYKHTVPLVSCKQVSVSDTFVILDTREYNEYKVSHLKSATWVGYDDFSKKRIKHIPKDTAILVYCSIGARSENIGERLKKMGYTKVKKFALEAIVKPNKI